MVASAESTGSLPSHVETAVPPQRPGEIFSGERPSIVAKSSLTEGAVEVDARLVARGLNLPVEQFMADCRRREYIRRGRRAWRGRWATASGGAPSAAGDRSVRKHSSGTEQSVKGAVAPTHTEDRQSNLNVPGKGRLAVRGGILRKKGGRAITERPMQQ